MELCFWLKTCLTFPSFFNSLTARERVWVSLGTHTFGFLLLWNSCALSFSNAGWGWLEAFITYHKIFPKTFFFPNLPMMFFRTAALRESQQVVLDSELLDTMPKQYVNREEQTTLHLECRGSSGKKCQGAGVVTVQVRLSVFIIQRVSFESLILAYHWERLKEVFSTSSMSPNI